MLAAEEFALSIDEVLRFGAPDSDDLERLESEYLERLEHARADIEEILREVHNELGR